MLRLLRQEEVLRIGFLVGGDRATAFSARWRVACGRDSSNMGPKARNPGPASTRSQHPTHLPGAIAKLESATYDYGMTAHLPGLAAAPASTGIDLGAARQSSLRKVRAEWPRTTTLT